MSIVESYACLCPLILFFCLSYVILSFYVCMFVSSIKSLFFVFFFGVLLEVLDHVFVGGLPLYLSEAQIKVLLK